jgi:hypothetical protein
MTVTEAGTSVPGFSLLEAVTVIAISLFSARLSACELPPAAPGALFSSALSPNARKARVSANSVFFILNSFLRRKKKSDISLRLHRPALIQQRTGEQQLL